MKLKWKSKLFERSCSEYYDLYLKNKFMHVYVYVIE